MDAQPQQAQPPSRSFGAFRTGLTGLLAALALASGASAQKAQPLAGKGAMKIRIIVNDRALSATLDDNATARDFAALLPLTLTLRDYAATEKVSDLPRRLSRQGAPAAFDPSVGDITYYAPWGNLAIFHRDFGNSPGLIRLGRLDEGAELLARPGPVTARIELQP